MWVGSHQHVNVFLAHQDFCDAIEPARGMFQKGEHRNAVFNHLVKAMEDNPEFFAAESVEDLVITTPIQAARLTWHGVPDHTLYVRIAVEEFLETYRARFPSTGDMYAQAHVFAAPWTTKQANGGGQSPHSTDTQLDPYNNEDRPETR